MTRFDLDTIAPEELVTVEYWKRVDWVQLLIVGAQIHVRLYDWSTRVLQLQEDTSSYLQAKRRESYYGSVASALDEVLRTTLPYWAREEAIAYFDYAIKNTIQFSLQ